MFKDKNGNPVDLERWGWIVVYDDDSELHQFNHETKEYNNYGSIDLPRVKRVIMNNFNGKKHTLDLPDGARFIHYYDNIIKSVGGDHTHYRVYCFGYELKGKQKIYKILPKDVLVEGQINQLDLL